MPKGGLEPPRLAIYDNDLQGFIHQPLAYKNIKKYQLFLGGITLTLRPLTIQYHTLQATPGSADGRRGMGVLGTNTAIQIGSPIPTALRTLDSDEYSLAL